MYPQIPVLLIAIVTSPGFRPSPFCTLSTVGSASLIHRSCFGFVKMPMFALVGLTIVAVWLILTMKGNDVNETTTKEMREVEEKGHAKEREISI